MNTITFGQWEGCFLVIFIHTIKNSGGYFYQGRLFLWILDINLKKFCERLFFKVLGAGPEGPKFNIDHTQRNLQGSSMDFETKYCCEDLACLVLKDWSWILIWRKTTLFPLFSQHVTDLQCHSAQTMTKSMLPTLIEKSVTVETLNPRLPFVGEEDLVRSSDPQIRS